MLSLLCCHQYRINTHPSPLFGIRSKYPRRVITGLKYPRALPTTLWPLRRSTWQNIDSGSMPWNNEKVTCWQCSHPQPRCAPNSITPTCRSSTSYVNQPCGMIPLLRSFHLLWVTASTTVDIMSNVPTITSTKLTPMWTTSVAIENIIPTPWPASTVDALQPLYPKGQPKGRGKPKSMDPPPTATAGV